MANVLTNLGLVGAVPPPVAFITSTLKLESTVNAAASPVAIIILLVPLKLNLLKTDYASRADYMRDTRISSGNSRLAIV